MRRLDTLNNELPPELNESLGYFSQCFQMLLRGRGNVETTQEALEIFKRQAQERRLDEQTIQHRLAQVIENNIRRVIDHPEPETDQAPDRESIAGFLAKELGFTPENNESVRLYFEKISVQAQPVFRREFFLHSLQQIRNLLRSLQ